MAGNPRSSGARRPSSGQRPGGGPSRPRPQERPRAEIRVRILDGASAGTEYAIQGAVIRMGRAEDNDIVLPDSNASRNHAELVRDPNGRYVVRDLGSRNGILVNRKKMPQAVLGNGDKVTVGSTTFEFVSPDHPGSDGGTLKRWLFLAIGAGVLGFAFVAIKGKGAQPAAAAGPIVVLPGSSVAPGAATPTPFSVGGDGVSIAELFATQTAAPAPGNPKGSEVSRNTLTKAAIPGAMTPLPRNPANEKMIATIMMEGERAYTGGRLVPARDAFERAMKLDPSNERAAARYEKIDKQIQKEITDAMSAGLSYMETERWDQAIMMFERVKFLDPDPGAMNNATASSQIAEAKQRKAMGGR